MKILIIGFITGITVSILLSLPVFRYIIEDKYKFGHNNGVLDGEARILDFMNEHFNSRNPPLMYEDSLILKPGAIYITESDGHISVVTTAH